MNTGCLKCDEKQKETGGNYELCDMHRLHYLEAMAHAAIADYVNKVNEILKEKENDNHRNDNTSKPSK